MKKIIGIIPARYASTRFPGKPLVDIGGKSMIRRVYEQALKATLLDRVVVATDDERIREHVRSFGGKVAMTRDSHPSGTDRCAEVLAAMDEKPGAVVNIQGDEPFIDPRQIDQVAGCFRDPEVQIATLVKKVVHTEELFNPNLPKVLRNHSGNAIFFSRQAIPHVRGVEEKEWIRAHTFYRHIGIYGYRADILPRLTLLLPSELEKAESLEQLRWIEHGYQIKTEITDFESVAVDTPDDLGRLGEFL